MLQWLREAAHFLQGGIGSELLFCSTHARAWEIAERIQHATTGACGTGPALPPCAYAALSVCLPRAVLSVSVETVRSYQRGNATRPRVSLIRRDTILCMCHTSGCMHVICGAQRILGAVRC